MATVVEVIEPTEKEYLVKLSQTEVDFLQGIMSDFMDNPQREVYLVYHVDQDEVQPSGKGKAALESIFNALTEIPMSEHYDYYDYWTNYPYGEEYEKRRLS